MKAMVAIIIAMLILLGFVLAVGAPDDGSGHDCTLGENC